MANVTHQTFPKPEPRPKSRRKPLRARSERRISYEAELDSITDALYARADFCCEICRAAEIYPLCRGCRGHRMMTWCDLCVGLFEAGLLGHRHHRLRRGQGGKNTMENVMAVCERDHKLIHANPDLSVERGWLLRRSG